MSASHDARNVRLRNTLFAALYVACGDAGEVRIDVGLLSEIELAPAR